VFVIIKQLLEALPWELLCRYGLTLITASKKEIFGYKELVAIPKAFYCSAFTAGSVFSKSDALHGCSYVATEANRRSSDSGSV